jgi:NHL repeat-containing protein/outer membrane protein with beta-barrel domain
MSTSACNPRVPSCGEGAAIVEITPLAVETTPATSGLGAASYLRVDSSYDLFIADNVNSDVIEFSTISVPLGYANVCQSGAPTPCSQTATLQFSVTESAISRVNVLTTDDSGLDFSQTDGSCNGETSPCQAIVSFQPTAPGMRTGAVEILDECLGEVLAVPLYGTGNAAEAAFSPGLASGPIGNDGFSDPAALAVAGNGVFGGGPIFIADDEACVIWIAGEDENFGIYAGTYGSCGYQRDGGTATYPGELNSPENVALDGAGNLSIADTGNAVIRKVDMNGASTTVAGDNERAGTFFGDGGPATNAGLNGPQGIALDSAGNLYIADTNNNRIRKVDLAGIITTVAGSGAASFTGDNGAATTATLDGPLGVRADTAGNIFIADSSNSVVLILCGLAGMMLFAAAAGAQEDHPPLEVGIDYNYVRANGPPGGCSCFSMNGANIWAAYSFTRSFSAVGEFSGQHTASINATGEDLTLYSYLFGPRYTLRKSERWLPFAQVLSAERTRLERMSLRSAAPPAHTIHLRWWRAAARILM